MIKVFIFCQKEQALINNNYEHFQTNEGINYPYSPIINQENLQNDPNWPFIDKNNNPDVNFSTEAYLKENFPEYEWVECRWLPIFINTSKDLSSICSFLANEKVIKQYGERIKLLKIENWGFSEETNEVMSINKWKRTSLPIYYKSQPPVFDNSINDDTISNRWMFDIDYWFTYWWIWIHTMRSTNLNVKFLLKETEPYSNFGANFTMWINQENDFDDVFMTCIKQSSFSPTYLDINLSDFVFATKNLVYTFISNYHIIGKSTLQTYLQNQLPNIFPILFNIEIFSWWNYCFFDDVFNTYFDSNQKIKSYIKNNGINISIDFNKEIWYNYNTKQELQRIIGTSDKILTTSDLCKLNKVNNCGFYIPVQVMSNLALVNLIDSNLMASLYTTDGTDKPYFQSKFYKYQDIEALISEDKYRLANGMFLYLVIAPEMFVNYQNYYAEALSKGKIQANSTGTYFQVCNKDNNTNNFLKNIDMKNGSFLLPIPNNYEYATKNTINGVEFDFSIDTFLSIYGSQIGLFTLEIPNPDGSGTPIVVQVTPGELEKNVKNIIMINKSPKLLQGLSLNTTNQTIDNISTIINNETITNMLYLAFFNSQENNGVHLVSYFPAIYFSDNSIYCRYESNNINSSNDYNISFFDKIWEFVNGDFSKWSLSTEPFLLSPLCLQTTIMLTRAQGEYVSLDITKLDISQFISTSWSFGMIFNFISNNITSKIALNELKNKSYIWDECETDLFIIDKRSTPFMVSGSNEAMKQQQLTNNTGINIAQQQFDFTEEWNKKQRGMEITGNVLSYFGKSISGTISGIFGGAKIGGGEGALIGGTFGLIGGLLSAGGETARLNFENQNRIAKLELDRGITWSSNVAKNLSYANVPNSKILDGNYSFLQKCPNPYISNQELFFDNFKTIELIEEQKLNILNEAKMFGRLWNYWADFNKFDIMNGNNFFALDPNTGMEGEYVYEIQKWLNENLKEEWSFADLINADAISIFIKKLYGGMRLYNNVLEKDEMLTTKISKGILKTIENNNLLIYGSSKKEGRPYVLDIKNLFNVSNQVIDWTNENIVNTKEPKFWWEDILNKYHFDFSTVDPDNQIVNGVFQWSDPNWIVFEASSSLYYVNTTQANGIRAEGENTNFNWAITKDGIIYYPDWSRSDFFGFTNTGSLTINTDANYEFTGLTNFNWSTTTNFSIISQNDTLAKIGGLNDLILSELTLPSHINEIMDECFKNSKIESFAKPLETDLIGARSFFDFEGMVEIVGQELNLNMDGSFAGAKIISFNVNTLLINQNNNQCFLNSNVIFLKTLNVNFVDLTIPAGCFEGSSISQENINMVNLNWIGLTTINQRAFYKSDWTFNKIEITNSIAYIGPNCFVECFTKELRTSFYDGWYQEENMGFNSVYFETTTSESNPEWYVWDNSVQENYGLKIRYTINPKCSFSTVLYKKIWVSDDILFKKITWDVCPFATKEMIETRWLGTSSIDLARKAKYKNLWDSKNLSYRCEVWIKNDNDRKAIWLNDWIWWIWGTQWISAFSLYLPMADFVGNAWCYNIWTIRASDSGSGHIRTNDGNKWCQGGAFLYANQKDGRTDWLDDKNSDDNWPKMLIGKLWV